MTTLLFIKYYSSDYFMACKGNCELNETCQPTQRLGQSQDIRWGVKHQYG